MNPRSAWLSCILAIVGLSLTSVLGQATQPHLSGAEELELRTLSGQLADTARSAKTRIEAAQLLLSRTYPQAAEALRGFLSDPANPGARIAVAEAVARSGQGRKEFIEPLMAMLTGDEPSIRAAAARALAIYKNNGVTGRLVQLALDAKRSQPIRLEIIASLQRVLDKRAVDALVQLLDDPDVTVVNAAAESLVKLTNIRTFGADRDRWKKWWQANANKPRSEWLADLAESLARSSSELERENVQLRDRLARAMEDMYAMAAPAQRDAMLLGLLKDKLPDVRLVGVKLSERRLVSTEKISPEVRAQVRVLLGDGDVRVRQRAAILVAGLAGPDASKALLDRLQAEEVPEVRKAVLTALGQLADPAALPAVLAGIDARQSEVAAAAARALARIAAKQQLEGELRAQASKTLLDRYQQTGKGDNGVDLIEALLTAMGAVGDEQFVPVLRAALKHKEATVRLAAVNGLRRFGKADLAAAMEPLVSDPDRGVRQAVIAALGTLGGDRNLDIILQRTDPAAESDAGVQQQAWDAVMGILSKADAAELSRVVSALSGRPDALDQRIKIEQKLVDALRAAKSPQLGSALRKLGEDLLKADRPAEAAAAMGEAYDAFAAARNAQAPDVWKQWIDAMLEADDPGVTKAMAAEKDEKLFAEAAKRLAAHLQAAPQRGKWQATARLCTAALGDLKQRLTAEQLALVNKSLTDAKGKLLEADRQKVPALVDQLVAPEESVRKAAAAELQAMGEGAVVPMLAALKKSLQSDNENRPLEVAVLAVLKQIAPKLVGYDASASKPERIKVVDRWLSEHGRSSGG